MSKIILPIHTRLDEIWNNLCQFWALVIHGTTGSGKSTIVPTFLHEKGQKVYIAQNRREVTEQVALWMEQCLDNQGLVGFENGAKQKLAATNTIQIFTDAILLKKVFQDPHSFNHDNIVFIIDEAHEATLASMLLLARLIQLKQSDYRFKLIIMSATIDSHALARYIDRKCPIIKIDTQKYSVETKVLPADQFQIAIQQQIDAGARLMVFTYGRHKINRIAQALQHSGHHEKAAIFRLYSSLPAAEREKVFKVHDGPLCILTTNAAENGLSVDVNVIIDDGLERIRYVKRDGVIKLNIEPTTLDAMTQRGGRTGRFRNGLVIQCSDTAGTERGNFKVPEIKRVCLAEAILLCLKHQLRLEDMDTYEPAEEQDIQAGYDLLWKLGAVDNNKNLTELGDKIGSYGVEPRFGRMIEYGRVHGVLKDVLLVVSMILAEGIRDPKCQRWKEFVSKGLDSDMLAELELYHYAEENIGQLGYIGIRLDHYHQAKNHFEKLCQFFTEDELTSSGDHTEIKRAMLSGYLDFVYKRKNHNFYRLSLYDGKTRKPTNICIVQPWDERYRNGYLVGQPFLIQEINKAGKFTYANFINYCSVVSMDDLLTVAPHMFSRSVGENPKLIDDKGSTTTAVFYNGAIIKLEFEPDRWHTPEEIAQFMQYTANRKKAGYFYPIAFVIYYDDKQYIYPTPAYCLTTSSEPIAIHDLRLTPEGETKIWIEHGSQPFLVINKKNGLDSYKFVLNDGHIGEDGQVYAISRSANNEHFAYPCPHYIEQDFVYCADTSVIQLELAE